MAEIVGELIAAVIEPLIWVIAESIQLVGHLIGTMLEALAEVAFSKSEERVSKPP